MRFPLRAVCQLDADEKKIARDLLDSLMLKPQARRWATSA